MHNAPVQRTGPFVRNGGLLLHTQASFRNFCIMSRLLGSWTYSACQNDMDPPFAYVLEFAALYSRKLLSKIGVMAATGSILDALSGGVLYNFEKTNKTRKRTDQN